MLTYTKVLKLILLNTVTLRLWSNYTNVWNIQGSTPGEVLAILVISLFLHVVLWAWLALLAMVPIVIVQIMWGKGGATMEEVQVYIGKETVLKSSSAIIYGITFMHASRRIVDSQLFRLWSLDNYWVSYGFKSDFLENCNSWYVI